MNKIKKGTLYFLSFLIPLIFILSVFFFKEFLTDKHFLLISDAYYQYYELLFYFKRIISGISSIFYTFSIGLGNSFFSTFAYYMTSPINFIVLFFSEENMHLAFLTIITLKLSLCGLTMFAYLKYHFKNSGYVLLAFSTAYALSAFNIGNYFQIMWLDGVMLAPLVLLGIDKLINENKSLLYGICLFLAILINYYIGYMICIFSIVYFAYRILEKYKIKEFKDYKNKIIKILIISVLAGSMTMILNYPNLLNILTINRGNGSFFINGTSLFDFNIVKSISKLYAATLTNKEVLNDDFIYLYCGVVIIPLIYLYFLNKNINKREKILTSIIYLILLLSVCIVPLNNFWHAFSTPIGFNYRYAFLFILFSLYIGCKSFVNLQQNKNRHYYFLAIASLLISIIMYIFTDTPKISIIITIVLLIIYLLIIKVISTDKKIQYLFILLMLGELYFNFHYTFFKNEFDYTKGLMGEYTEKKNITDYIKNNDDSLYRMDFYNSKYNDAIQFNYISTSGWLSTMNSSVVNFMCKIGYTCTNNLYKYSSFITLDSLLGVKYYFSENEIGIYEKIRTFPISVYYGYMYGFQTKDAYLYKNPLALQFGYMVSNDVKENLNCDQLYDCQEQMMSQMMGQKANVFYPTEIEEVDSNNFLLTITKNLDFTLSYEVEYKDKNGEYEYNIYVNDELFQTNDDESSKNIAIPNTYKIGDKVKIRFEKVSGTEVLESVYINYRQIENFANVYNTLSKQQLNISSFSDTNIKATIDVLNDDVLFTTIPYEKGWNVYVDGKKVSTYSIYDTFLGFDLTKGKHDIEFVYKTPGLKTGIIISSISTILFIFYQIYEYKKNKNSSN